MCQSGKQDLQEESRKSEQGLPTHVQTLWVWYGMLEEDKVTVAEA